MNCRICLGEFIYFWGCANHLSLMVIDADTKEGLDDVSISVKSDDRRIPLNSNTSGGGIAEFKDIKKTPIDMTLSKTGEYFPVKKIISDGSLKGLIIEMERLQTILLGEVLEDSTFLPVEDCVIETDPPTVTETTDGEGRYEIKSKLFLDAQYDVIALHEKYQPGRQSNIFIRVNEKNPIPPIEIKTRPEKVDEIDTIKVVDPGAGDGKVRLVD